MSVRDNENLRSYLKVLSRRRITALITTVVVVGLALGYVFVSKPQYTSTARVLLPSQSITSSPVLGSLGQQQVQASQQNLLADAQQFAEGDATKRIATTTLGYKPKVTVTTSTTADVLSFSATNGTAADAARTVNAYTAAFITALRQSQVDQYTQQVTALEKSITTIQAGESKLSAGSTQLAADQQSVTTLTQTLQALEAQLQLATQSGPSVLQSAVPPKAPSSPKPLEDGILGLVVGLGLGVGLAFLKEQLDDKVGSLTDVEHYSGGVPVLGTIPSVSAWRDQKQSHVAFVEDPDSPVSEAYRTCRTAVQFIGIEQPHRIVAITSSTPGEGKTTTAANLAVSFARSGSKVIVVSCDFRRPRLHEFFGVRNDTGMTSVLLGRTALADAMRPVKGEDNLRVLTSGPVPPNPAEILSLDRVRKLMDVLAANADLVIVDCPPVLPVTDTLLVSRLVDGIVVLAVAGKTKRHDLQRTVELLRQVDAPIFGTLVNRVPSGGAYAGGYGYGYGYGTYSRTKELSLQADPDQDGGRRAGRSRARVDTNPSSPDSEGGDIVDLSDADLTLISSGLDQIRNGAQKAPSRRGGHEASGSDR